MIRCTSGIAPARRFVYTNGMNRITSCLLVGLFAVISACKPAAERQTPAPAARSVSAATGTATKVSGLLTPVSGGAPVTLDQLSSQPVLLVVFAPWSDSAAATVAWMNSASVPGLELIPVVLDRSGSSPVPDVQGRVVYRADEGLAESLGVRALPTAVRVEAGRGAALWAGFPSFTGITASATSSAPGG